jgi:hypothetical protein
MAERIAAERVILNDCCEDWILEWGSFYDKGMAFACPECGTEWRAQGEARYEREGDEHVFRRRDRRAGVGAFPYLGSEDGVEPLTERCCAKILLERGAQLAIGDFVCPVSRTKWHVGSARAHGLRLPTFTRDGLAEPLTIQPGKTRSFLVGLSHYSPPRE